MCSLPRITESDSEDIGLSPTLARTLVQDSLEAARNQIAIQSPSESGSDTDSETNLNMNSKRRDLYSTNQNSRRGDNLYHHLSDSDEDNDFVKVAPQGIAKETKTGNSKFYRRHLLTPSTQPYACDSTQEQENENSNAVFQKLSWSSKVTYLNTLSTPELLALADQEAVTLCSGENGTGSYGKAISDVLMTWQQLRSGKYRKDCRVWLWKNRDADFHSQPFSVDQGFGGFVVRKSRKAPLVDDLTPEGYTQRMHTYHIECSVFDQVTREPRVIRLNSKKDQHTERYKGTRLEEEDPVICRWDNTGFHRSGDIELPEDDVEGIVAHPDSPMDETDVSPTRVIHRCASDLSPSTGMRKLSCRDNDDSPNPPKRRCSDPTITTTNRKMSYLKDTHQGFGNANSGSDDDDNKENNSNQSGRQHSPWMTIDSMNDLQAVADSDLKDSYSALQALSSESSCMCSDCHPELEMNKDFTSPPLSQCSSSWSLAAVSVRSGSPSSITSEQDMICIPPKSSGDEELNENAVDSPQGDCQKNQSHESDLLDLISLCSERQELEEEIVRRTSPSSEQGSRTTSPLL